MQLSVSKRRIYKTTQYTQFQKCALPILWNIFKGTAFMWNVGTKWGKLLRKQSSSLHNGSRNHFPDWQSKTELIGFKDHAYIYISPPPGYWGLLHYVFIPRVKQWIKNSAWLFYYICEKSMQKKWVEVWQKCIWFIHDSTSLCP